VARETAKTLSRTGQMLSVSEKKFTAAFQGPDGLNQTLRDIGESLKPGIRTFAGPRSSSASH